MRIQDNFRMLIDRSGREYTPDYLSLIVFVESRITNFMQLFCISNCLCDFNQVTCCDIGKIIQRMTFPLLRFPVGIMHSVFVSFDDYTIHIITLILINPMNYSQKHCSVEFSLDSP